MFICIRGLSAHVIIAYSLFKTSKEEVNTVQNRKTTVEMEFNEFEPRFKSTKILQNP